MVLHRKEILTVLLLAVFFTVFWEFELFMRQQRPGSPKPTAAEALR